MKTYGVYLNGQMRITTETYPVINPATGEPFALMSKIGRSEVAQALKDAQAAFSPWRQLTGKARGEFLRKIAAELDRRSEEIARLITLENGKPLSQSQAAIAMSVDHLGWFAEEARRAYGRVIP